MTPVALAAQPTAPPRRRLGGAPLAVKLAFAFLGLVAFVLIVNGAVDTYLTYNQAKRAALEVEQEKARGAAERVGGFLSEIQTQLGWTTGVEWGYGKPEQQRYDFIRLLRQAPAITALSYIDGHGKEQLAVSRLEPDAVASGKDLSADPRFQRAVADQIWFGPVEFRRGSEPYMTIAVAHVGKTPGVTVADVNLKLIWDVVSEIHVGANGYAYVVDDHGRLIAHPDLSLVLRDSDLSHLPQVEAALARERAPQAAAPQIGTAEVARSLDGAAVLTAYAIAPKTRWAVFVEQPLAEALATAYGTLARALALLGLGLTLAAVSGVALARRMAAPIRLLQAGAERLGAGDLTQRLDIRTGDEVEALADGFNRMAGSLQESYENLEAKVEARTRDLNEALAQQTATADVLKVISRSVFDLDTVLQTLIDTAVRLTHGSRGTIFLKQGDVLVARAFHSNVPGELRAYLASTHWRLDGDSHMARAARERSVVHVADLTQSQIASDKEVQQRASFGAGLWTPLMREREIIGVFGVPRDEPIAFSDREIELVQTFADQAVIAIENSRLFEEVQARTHELEEALAQQTATAEVLKVISRSPSDLKPVLDAIADTAAQLCGSQMTMFFRFDGEAFRILASWNFPDDVRAMLEDKAPAPGHPSALGRAGATLKPAYIPDVLADPDYGLRTEQGRARYRATLAVPMLREGRLVGALSLNRAEPGSFTQKHIGLVSTFADQAAIAFENVRLFEQVQARTRDLEESLARQTATADVLKIISRSIEDAAPVFETILESCQRLFDPFGAAIYLVDGDMAQGVARRGFDGRYDWGADRMPLAGSATGQAIAERRAVHFPDLAEKPGMAERLRIALTEGGGMTVLYAPMLSGERGVGSLVVTRRPKRPFTKSEIDFVQTFADQAVIAIENARLFKEVQARTRDLGEALERQTATAEILKVISASPTDAKPVFDAIALTAVRLFGCQMAGVFRVSGETLTAVTGAWPDRMFRDDELAPPMPLDPAANFPSRAVVSGNTVLINEFSGPDVPAHERYIAERYGVASALFLPMSRGEESIGVFLLTAGATDAFDAKDVALAESFRDQALIAVENARLFRETQEALLQQTATADVLKVISRSAFDLDAIFQTLVTTAVDLCKASSGTLCVRDGDVYRYRGMAGPEASAELQRFLVDHPLVTPTRNTIAGRTILSGRTEEIRDVALEENYAVPFTSLASPARALLGVPLTGKTEALGAIVVARAEPGAFPPRHVEILRTFADQAVIAIENSRLFEEVQARTRELEQSLEDLRKAQDRLVQSEKLASLGQLTAGIAHEIENPLNFVNNFATLSRELLEELRETLGRLPQDAKSDADDLMGMINSNLEKVASHGKRANSIVKNMLLHSREGSGERTRVNVNAMVEEALNLGYHGARAEKPGFNVTIEKALDPDAGEADLYLQEVTRVLLNLISNGFYAGAKRKQSEGPDYEPTLRAATRSLGRSVEIRIRDNGTGIPDDVRAKMFNPFFTTKPAGEGTGLGLSLSHDIIVKQHGGTLDVETAPGAFTEFVITLPREGEGT